MIKEKELKMLKISKEKRQKLQNYQCSIEAGVAMIGGKYKIIILWHLTQNQTMRYSEIQRVLPKATAKMLSNQLKELENDSLIIRKLYPVIPPKTEYSLSELGKSLSPIIQALKEWGEEYFKLCQIELKKDTSCYNG